MTCQTDQIEYTVRRRRIFYIPGYDPIPPRRYRELYRREAARQAQICGYEVAIRSRSSGQDYGWSIEARMDGQPVSAEMEVLVWSDIVRNSMSNSIPGTYLQLCQVVWTYVSTGALRRLMWLRKGPVIAALYPVVVLILQALLALAVLLVCQWAGAHLTGSEGWPGVLGRLAGAALGAGLTVWLLRWFRAQDHRIYAYYLMHDYAHTASLRGAIPPELDARLDLFAARIGAALAEDVDEVLVVGHSSGAHLAVMALARVIAASGPGRGGTQLSFLSLGQVVPMLSFLPHAQRLRTDLRTLSESRALSWVDVSAPGDGCTFAICDPVAVSGVARERQIWPLVLSAAFSQTMGEAEWKAARWRFFRLHFQYLCAFARPESYDYFRITAGPQPLFALFEGRKPSRSRIDVPASGYRSVLPT